MNDPLDIALCALSSAAAARALYFDGHPAVADALRRAHEALTPLLAERSSIEVHCVEDRVIGPSGSLPSSDTLREGLFAPLARRSMNSLHFEAGLTKEELASFIAVLPQPAQSMPPMPHLSVGSTVVAQVAPCDPSGPLRSRADLAGELEQAWVQAPDPRSVDARRMETVAAGICAAVSSAGGTLLEIANLKSHDEYTYIHTVNVALLAAALGGACGLGPDRVHEITLAALLHDIGKRLLPTELLNKTSQLSPEERAIMNRHPSDGAALLLGTHGVPDIAPIVAYEHHMHLDGTGYPARPATWKPHIAAQIVQQADVFDALRTHRPYRAAMSTQEASDVLRQGAGTKYDAALVDTFIRRVARRAPAPASSAARAA